MTAWEEYCRWRPAFGEVLDPRYYTLEWLDAQIITGEAFFASTPDAAIIFEVKTYPTGARDIHGLIAAGELHDIREVLIPVAEECGRSLNCVGALISSREGWAKALRSSGYETHQVTIRREL